MTIFRHLSISGKHKDSESFAKHRLVIVIDNPIGMQFIIVIN